MVAEVKKSGVLAVAAVGVAGDYFSRAELLVRAGCDALLVDIAYGHMSRAIEATGKLKDRFGTK